MFGYGITRTEAVASLRRELLARLQATQEYKDAEIEAAADEARHNCAGVCGRMTCP